jgi:hypothetical protein
MNESKKIRLRPESYQKFGNQPLKTKSVKSVAIKTKNHENKNLFPYGNLQLAKRDGPILLLQQMLWKKVICIR